MTVAELIAALEGLPGNARVFLGSHDGAKDPPLHAVLGEDFVNPEEFVVFLNPDFNSAEGFNGASAEEVGALMGAIYDIEPIRRN